MSVIPCIQLGPVLSRSVKQIGIFNIFNTCFRLFLEPQMMFVFVFLSSFPVNYILRALLRDLWTIVWKCLLGFIVFLSAFWGALNWELVWYELTKIWYVDKIWYFWFLFLEISVSAINNSSVKVHISGWFWA